MSSSVVVVLYIPPSNRSPSSLCQVVWPSLFSAKEWLGTHTPEEKEMQLVRVK